MATTMRERDSDRETMMGTEETIQEQPPVKKPKVQTAPQMEEYQEEEYEHDFEEWHRLYAESRKDFLLSCVKFEPIDISNAVPILEDLQELDRLEAHLSCVAEFLTQCHNARTLLVYDRPGNAKFDGYYHVEGEQIAEHHRKVARFVFNWYCDNFHKGSDSKLELQSVDKMSCSPICDREYFVTITVVNMLTADKLTLQAQVLELGRDNWMLGMLRDWERGEVLAIIKLKEGPTEKMKIEFKQVPEKAWERILLIPNKDTVQHCLSGRAVV